jgi:hypothetical protein
MAADEAASHDPEPSVFDGARVAAKAAPTKADPDSCIRVPIRGRPRTDAEMNFGLQRGFSPELSALDGAKGADEAASPNPGPSVFGGAKGRGESRSYQMSIFL